MHNIRTNFIKILEVIKEIIGDEINEKGNYLRRGSVPRFSAVEVMALSLTAECLSIDSENYMFSKLNKEYLNDFENLISRRQSMIVESYYLKRQKACAMQWQSGLTDRQMFLQ